MRLSPIASVPAVLGMIDIQHGEFPFVESTLCDAYHVRVSQRAPPRDALETPPPQANMARIAAHI